MTAVGHIAVGLIVARHTGSQAAAFAVGIGSHAVMDWLLPEFRGWPPRRYWPWWLWQAVGSIILLCRGWPWAIWGIAGSVLPDLVDGAYSLLRPQAWQTGRLLCPWHRAGAEWCKRDMGWALTIIVEALLTWRAW